MRRLGLLASLLLATVIITASAGTSDADEVRATITVPATIDPTGTTDVTEELNAFLESVADDSVVEFHPHATYRVEGTVVVAAHTDLILKFQGAQLVAHSDGSTAPPYPAFEHRWPRHRTHLLIVDSDRVTVTGLTVIGANDAGGTSDEAWRADLEAQHGIEVSRSRSISITECDLSKTYGDAIYIGGGSIDVGVSDCDLHHVGRQGVAITNARQIEIRGNHVWEIRRSAFDLEPVSDWFVSDVRISDNRVGKVRLNMLSGWGSGSEFSNVFLEDNVAYASALSISMKAPESVTRGQLTVRRNKSETVFGSPRALIYVEGFSSVEVSQNEQSFDGRAGGAAVEIYRACDVTIFDNRFLGVDVQRRGSDGSTCKPQTTKSGSTSTTTTLNSAALTQGQDATREQPEERPTEADEGTSRSTSPDVLADRCSVLCRESRRDGKTPRPVSSSTQGPHQPLPPTVDEATSQRQPPSPAGAATPKTMSFAIVMLAATWIGAAMVFVRWHATRGAARHLEELEVPEGH